MTEPPQTNPTHGQLVEAGQQAGWEAQEIEMRKPDDLFAVGRNSMRKVSHEDWEWVLEQVAMGRRDKMIVDDLQKRLSITLSPAVIAAKRRDCQPFADAYRKAWEDAVLNIAVETIDIADGVAGVSSQDVQRDRLMVETRLKVAAAFNKKVFGNKVEHEVQQMVIHTAMPTHFLPDKDSPNF